jgi:hypothetical protein
MNFQHMRHRRNLKEAHPKSSEDCGLCKRIQSMGPVFSEQDVLKRKCRACGYTIVIQTTNPINNGNQDLSHRFSEREAKLG